MIKAWINVFPERLGEESLKSQVAQLRMEWRQAKRSKRKKAYTDILWGSLKKTKRILANREKIAWHKAMLDAQTPIVSLRKDEDGWTAKIWISQEDTKESGCEDSFVASLLGPLVYEDDRFRQGDFAVLGKYDQISEVEETTFRSIRQLSDGAFKLVDMHGARARVSTTWAQKNMRKALLRLLERSIPREIRPSF